MPFYRHDGDNAALRLLSPAVEEALEIDSWAIEFRKWRSIKVLGFGGHLALGKLMYSNKTGAHKREIATKLHCFFGLLGLKLRLGYKHFFSVSVSIW